MKNFLSPTFAALSLCAAWSTLGSSAALAQQAKPETSQNATPAASSPTEESPAKTGKEPNAAEGKGSKETAPASDKQKTAGDGANEQDMELARSQYTKGKSEFDKGNYREAVTLFKESYRLSKNPLLLYNVAFTLDKLEESPMALFYYKKFLDDSDESAANRDTSEERILALEGGSDASQESGETEGAFKHAGIDEAPPGSPLDLTTIIPDGAPWTVVLYYRGKGATKFTAVPMRERSGELVGRIPAAKMQGSNIQYYIEANDEKGDVVHNAGQSTSPNIVLIDAAAKPRFYADFKSTGSSKTMNYSDRPAGKYSSLKWGTTLGAGALFLAAGGFNAWAGSKSNSINSEATDSQTGCNSPPCRVFAPKQENAESRGKFAETATNVTLVLGVAAGVTAGVLWILDAKDPSYDQEQALDSTERRSFIATPVVSDDYIGGAASLRF